jgi:death-on-curing protein
VTEPTVPIDYLSLNDLLEIAAGVIDHPVVRDVGLLASAAARPQLSVFGDDAYPTFAEKIAALMESIGRNHALVDGNKRLTWAAARVFCLMNGFDLAYEVDEAEALVLDVAQGKLELVALAGSLRRHLR